MTSLAHQSSNQRRIEHEVPSATNLTTVFDYRAAPAKLRNTARREAEAAEAAVQSGQDCLRDDQTSKNYNVLGRDRHGTAGRQAVNNSH